jgi:hypothetical protein
MYNSENGVCDMKTKEIETKGRRGRKALEGLELNIPGLRSILAGKEISPYYKQKLAAQGLIRLIAYKEPGTRGRPTFIPQMTDKGYAYYEKNASNVQGHLILAAESKAA